MVVVRARLEPQLVDHTALPMVVGARGVGARDHVIGAVGDDLQLDHDRAFDCLSRVLVDGRFLESDGFHRALDRRVELLLDELLVVELAREHVDDVRLLRAQAVRVARVAPPVRLQQVGLVAHARTPLVTPLDRALRRRSGDCNRWPRQLSLRGGARCERTPHRLGHARAPERRLHHRVRHQLLLDRVPSRREHRLRARKLLRGHRVERPQRHRLLHGHVRCGGAKLHLPAASPADRPRGTLFYCRSIRSGDVRQVAVLE
mmetsp:Transcript_73643/g.195895  ORF Transcript_73643/g.195895 Transcript_73643/m.195895 type:complete len:260 (-) Transcript_73643:42-821(-)